MDKKINPIVESPNPTVPFALMDQEDERQIVSSMQGEYIKEYVYSFNSKGKVVTGLSKVGVDQVCLEAARSKNPQFFRIIGDPIIRETDKDITVIVKAGQYASRLDSNGVYQEVLLNTRMGSAKQSKKMRLKNNSFVEDPFFLQKAMSKAQRNALSAILPIPLIKELIHKYINAGQVKHIHEQPKINENQRRRLHALSSEKGLKHEDLLKIVKDSYGFDSTKDILIDNYEQICKTVEAYQAETDEIPEKVKKGFELLNYPIAKQKASWAKALLKWKDQAETNSLKRINELLDKRS